MFERPTRMRRARSCWICWDGDRFTSTSRSAISVIEGRQPLKEGAAPPPPAARARATVTQFLKAGLSHGSFDVLSSAFCSFRTIICSGLNIIEALAAEHRPLQATLIWPGVPPDALMPRSASRGDPGIFLVGRCRRAGRRRPMCAPSTSEHGTGQAKGPDLIINHG